MSGARITVDGLWRCLCPSIDAVALTTAISVPYRSRRVGRPSASAAAATTTCAGPRTAPRRRHLHTTSRKLQDDKAESKRDPSAVLGRGDTEAKRDPKAIDLSDGKTVIDQESTDAWKGYFDVVIREGSEQRQDKFPVSESVASSRMGDAKTRGKSGTALDANSHGQHDAFDELFGAEEEEQYSLPNNSSDGGQDPSAEALNGIVGKDPFDVFRDAHHESQGRLGNFDDFRLGTASMLAEINTEAASSTDSVPLSRDSNKTQPLNGSDRNTRSQRQGDEKMVGRLLQMKPPFNEVPPEATKEDILMTLGWARMRAPRRYRRITATLLKHLISMDPKPLAFYYDLLFRAHCLPEGSADVIANLLQEMRHERIHWSSNAYHSVLRVCSHLPSPCSSLLTDLGNIGTDHSPGLPHSQRYY